MMIRCWLVVALVGCGAKLAEPLELPRPLKPNELPLSRAPHVGPIQQQEIMRFRARLQATHTQAQRLDKLDPPECVKAQASLPPVQP